MVVMASPSVYDQVIDNAHALISYARISADTERDEHGVESQHRRNRDAAHRHGCVIAIEITDNDLSASKDIYREGFDQLVRALAVGRTSDGIRIDGVVVVEQSRLARRHTDWERFTDALTLKDGRVYIEAGSRLDPYSEDFDLRGDLGTLINKSEAKKIKRRTKASHADRALRGVPVGGTRPYGWLDDRRTRDETEARHIRAAARMYLAREPVRAICRQLTADGSVTPAGNPWSPHALKQMLANPRLCGYRRLHGELVRDAEGQPVVGQWEPIIDVATWEAIVEQMDSRKTGEVQTVKHPPRYLLSGLNRCGRCMRRMRGTARPSARGGFLYVCDKNVGGCGGVCRNGGQVDAFVEAAFLARHETLVVGTVSTGSFPQQDELEDALNARATMTDLWRGKQISNDIYFAELPPIEATIRQLTLAKERHDAATSRAAAIPSDLVTQWHTRQDDREWRRKMLFAALHAVVLQPVGKGVRRYDEMTINLIWRE